MSNSAQLFPGHDHTISWTKANKLRAKFREHREKILTPEHHGKDVLPFSETFNRQAIEELLNEPGCVAIRIYYGMEEDMKAHLILVAVDANKNDIGADPSAIGKDSATTTPVENGIRCPPNC